MHIPVIAALAASTLTLSAAPSTQPSAPKPTPSTPAAPKTAAPAEIPSAISKLSLDPATQPYALNVVYLVPSDMEPFPGYEKRVSDIVFSIQDFYRKEMTRNGFQNRTFGLRTRDGGKAVDIVTIRCPGDKSLYRYENGVPSTRKVLADFFAANPSRKYSDHTLIIMPSISGKDMEPGGVPFYGVGSSCYALDYPLFDLKYIGKQDATGRLFTKWYGGMAHELGHGLNLPHNCETVQERKTLGTALMGAGNYTLGQQPTFITPASCAILDQSQTFRTAPAPASPAKRLADLPELKIDVKAEAVSVSGKLPDAHRVKHVIAYYDKDTFGGVNDDYDAEAFVCAFDPANGTFSTTMPMSEIRPGKTDKYQIRIRLIHDDGGTSIIRRNFPVAAN